MATSYSEDHPDRNAEATVPATPVEGLDREPEGNKPWIQAKVVAAPEKAAPKKSAAQVKSGGK
jgi:hypothetical protein